MQDTMHDIFDVEFAAEIEEAVTTEIWSELPQELVQKMVETLKWMNLIPRQGRQSLRDWESFMPTEGVMLSSKTTRQKEIKKNGT